MYIFVYQIENRSCENSRMKNDIFLKSGGTWKIKKIDVSETSVIYKNI